MKNNKLATKIYDDLNKKGANLGNVSIILINNVIDKHLSEYINIVPQKLADSIFKKLKNVLGNASINIIKKSIEEFIIKESNNNNNINMSSANFYNRKRKISEANLTSGYHDSINKKEEWKKNVARILADNGVEKIEDLPIAKQREIMINKSINLNTSVVEAINTGYDTLYYEDGFGSISKKEVKTLEFGTKAYAQYSAAPFIKYIEKGKRKPTGFLKAYKPYILLLKGTGHPDPDSMFDKVDDTVSKSRYTSFDGRYKTDFDKVIDKYITDNNVEVLFDHRDTKGKDSSGRPTVGSTNENENENDEPIHYCANQSCRKALYTSSEYCPEHELTNENSINGMSYNLLTRLQNLDSILSDNKEWIKKSSEAFKKCSVTNLEDLSKRYIVTATKLKEAGEKLVNKNESLDNMDESLYLTLESFKNEANIFDIAPEDRYKRANYNEEDNSKTKFYTGYYIMNNGTKTAVVLGNNQGNITQYAPLDTVEVLLNDKPVLVKRKNLIIEGMESKPIKSFKASSLLKIINDYLGFPTKKISIKGDKMLVEFKDKSIDISKFTSEYFDFQYDGGALGGWLPDIIDYKLVDGIWEFEMQKVYGYRNI